MCRNDTSVATGTVIENKDESAVAKKAEKQENLVRMLSFTTGVFLAATIALAVQGNKSNTAATTASTTASTTAVDAPNTQLSNVPDNTPFDIASIFSSEGDNKCAGANPKFDNVDCVHLPGPQAGANVTKGFVGGMEVDVVPNLNNYWQSSMCPVNVHWHLGTEHYSKGEYDENGNGPDGNIGLAPHSGTAEDYEDGVPGHVTYDEMTDDEIDSRNLAADGHKVRGGFRCHFYDPNQEKFTKPYEWKHCQNMVVGETYEVHWPHSAAGACGTVNQYQTPFYDGVFCNLDLETFSTLGPQDIASAVGVQAQIYTVVNDESYFYPDLIRGWIVDNVDDMAKDIAYYTGSTTGTSRNNDICSQYTPITWQVDRKCHMISASSFDKLCYDMKNQRDDMSTDLHAHGSRELVKDSLVANNQARKLKDTEAEADNERELTPEQVRHLRTYGHYHSDGDHHHEWF
jgi:preprotein translocase subunit SecG